MAGFMPEIVAGMKSEWVAGFKSESLAGLIGIRSKFYDNEMDARAREKSGGGGDDVDPKVQAEAVVKSVASLPPLGPAISIGPVRPSATGLGVFLARIKDGAGGSLIEIVSQVERTDNQLRADARDLLDRERLNGSPAGPVVHLLRLSREFLGKLDRCENLIRIKDGKPQFLMKVKERSVKTAKHLAAEFHAAIDGLDESLPYYLFASDTDEIFTIADKDASVENWRFANALNEEFQKEDLVVTDYFLEADTSSGPKRWELVSASAAEETSLKSLDAAAGQPAFTIGRIAWRSLIAFAQQKHELKDGTKEGFAPGYDFGLIDDSLIVNTVGTKAKGDPVSLTVISNDGSSPRFELRHKTLISLDELQSLSSDGSLSFSLGDDGAMTVSATGKRATYAVFLNKDTVEKPPKGKGRGKGKKSKTALEAKPADQAA